MKFKVQMIIKQTYECEVDAESEANARWKAIDIYSDDVPSPNLERMRLTESDTEINASQI